MRAGKHHVLVQLIVTLDMYDGLSVEELAKDLNTVVARRCADWGENVAVTIN